VGVQVVEMFQPAFRQQIVDDEATLAAENLVLLSEPGIPARFAAVKTMGTPPGCGISNAHSRGTGFSAGRPGVWRFDRSCIQAAAHFAVTIRFLTELFRAAIGDNFGGFSPARTRSVCPISSKRAL
jgi:hypothetical protein